MVVSFVFEHPLQERGVRILRLRKQTFLKRLYTLRKLQYFKDSHKCHKSSNRPGLVVTLSISAQEAEDGRTLSSKLVWSS